MVSKWLSRIAYLSSFKCWYGLWLYVIVTDGSADWWGCFGALVEIVLSALKEFCGFYELLGAIVADRWVEKLDNVCYNVNVKLE